MLLQRTISQLDVGYVSDDVAEHLGHLGYAQWLGGLKGTLGYREEAMRAYAKASPFMRSSPAVAVFCQLLVASTVMPPVVLDLKLPKPSRRGGAKARRGAY